MKTTILKKAAALLLCLVLLLSVPFAQAAAAEIYDTGVRVRDPFVIQHEGVYYMYGTGLAAEGYGCVYGTDLRNWSEPVRVCEPVSDAAGDWWAPECHFYKGSFYLFATYRSAQSGKRGVAIFRANSPLGPFEIITGGHITPKNRDCIDGTLWVDESGQPWMVYVGEWTSNEDGIGNMTAAKLSDDLTAFVSEPVVLFRASDGGRNSSFVTDGPFLYKTENGRLIMLWSNNDSGAYCVKVAYSSDGRVDGRWKQQPGYLYRKTNRLEDGGHGMIFTAPDSTLTLSLHSPNFATEESPTTAVFVPVADIGDTLVMQKEDNIFTRIYYRFYYFFAQLTEFFGFTG